MVAKKYSLQKESAKLLEQAKERFKKFGKELSTLAKKSEKGIRKASKAGKIQFDIMSLKVRREKVYYDIGKKVASLNAKKKLGIPELEPYLTEIRKLETNARKKKRELSNVRKEKK